MREKTRIDSIVRCARYAFAPNYFHYCGPDANQTIVDYIRESFSDEGLIREIKEFQVLYPYLVHIAHANNIRNPFDHRVVDAYWVGNPLLDTIPVAQSIEHLHIDQNLKQKISKKSLRWIVDTIPLGAKLHHSFHVFTVFMRTGHHAVTHTIETMDECKISWGQVVKKSKVKSQKSKLQVKTEKLEFMNGEMKFNSAFREVTIPFHDIYDYEEGDWVTYHWGMVCEKVTENEVRRLSAVTKHNLRIANSII